MISSFVTGVAILLGFAVLHLIGTVQIAKLLERKTQDEVERAKHWGLALGAWTIVVSLAFGLFSLTDWADPVSKLGPLISGFGALFGIMISLTKFKAKED